MSGKKKEFRWGCFASVLIHLILISFAAFYTINKTGMFNNNSNGAAQGGDKSQNAKSEVVKKDPTAVPAVSHQKISGYIDQARKRVAGQDSKQQMTELEEKAKWLKNKSSQEAINAAAGFLENFQGTGNDSRAYEPVEGVQGEFDTASAVLYDFEKVTHNEKDVYIRVFVDKDGRVLKESPDSVGPLTEDDKKALKVFQLARDNPALRRIIISVTKMSEKKKK